LSFVARRRDRPSGWREELYALRDRLIISSAEELLNVKVVSGNPKIELITGLTTTTYGNNIGVKIEVPPNSTVEVAWGKVPYNLEYVLHFSLWRQIDAGIVYSLGIAYFNESDNIQWTSYPYTNLSGDGTPTAERFIVLSINWYGEVGLALKLQNTTSDTLTAIVTFINIFIVPPHIPRILQLSITPNITVTETSETTKYTTYLYIPFFMKNLRLAYINIGCEIQSDGTNTLTVNIYLNDKLVKSSSTTSSSKISVSTSFFISNKAKSSLTN
jgi:hypothetical protein